MDNDNDPHRIIFDPQNNQGNEAFVPPGFDEESSSEEEDENEEQWLADLQRIREDGPGTKKLSGSGLYSYIQNMTGEDWEELGRDISNNTHLQNLTFYDWALDDVKCQFLFRGLTRSSSIKNMELYGNNTTFGVNSVRSMVPFLQNANNLVVLNLNDNYLRSEGFNVLFRTLSNSPIKELYCGGCGIESIEIDINYIPKHLKFLQLGNNSISTDGCRAIAKLLQVGNDATLTTLWLFHNKIDDDGVEILVDALQSNTSLKTLNLRENNDISNQGKISLLRLVIDISSIGATLQSNHTLHNIGISSLSSSMYRLIQHAVAVNQGYVSDPEPVGREKVIETQLHSETRAALCCLQGVDHSVFNEIDPLHLPEILSLIAQRHGHGEFYTALSSSIVTLFSTVNRKKCIQQQMEYHAAKAAEHRNKVEELGAELAAIEVTEGNEDRLDSQSNKRRRK